MQLIHSVPDLRQRLSAERAIAFVPTMGNLHEGHIELVRIARQQGSCVVVSVLNGSASQQLFRRQSTVSLAVLHDMD